MYFWKVKTQTKLDEETTKNLSNGVRICRLVSVRMVPLDGTQSSCVKDANIFSVNSHARIVIQNGKHGEGETKSQR